MKKKIHSELRTIAKRILDSDETLDTASLRSLIAQLYERVLALNYLEQQPEKSEVPLERSVVGSSMDSKSYREQNWFKDPEPVPQPTYSEEIAEPLIEKIKDIVAQIPQESQKVDELLNELLPKKEISKNELEDFASHYQETPVFERKEPDISQKHRSLNETVDQSLNVGLNDRLAFVKHLFNNDLEEFMQVLSRINSMHSFDEAKAFVLERVKPAHNNWKNKDKFEQRFMTLVEKRFN